MSDPVSRLNAALESRYSIERVLGEGGMATVYLANDLKHERQVALKVLKPELAAVVGAERFLAEIKTTANLQHPHILPLFDSGEADSFLYFVMPCVEGESLRQKLDREHQLPVDEAVRIASDIAEALDYAHRHNVIHRDIKPENILLHDGRPMVADFGIAFAVNEGGGERLTKAGMAFGTPEYMSPEQASAEWAPDGRSDTYSLACVLYEMLAGEPPYTGPTALAVFAKRLTEPVPSVRRLRDTVPEVVEQAVMRALARVAADRFDSVAAFADALTTAVAARASPMSVAVLPFLNIGTDPENEFFSDGITEDIIAQLSKIGALKVISRTSVMQFKAREQSLKLIGAALGVGTVLEGSVRRVGDRVRIVAQLIDAETDGHLWTETYDRELTDVFAIQSDVAFHIADALEAELSADERVRIEREPTEDPKAYNLYLQGRHCLLKYTLEGIRQGIEFLEQAIAADTDYAQAYTAMAFAYVQLGLGYVGYGEGSLRPEESYSKAKQAAATAFELDDSLDEAYLMLGVVKFMYEFDWTGAEQDLRRAVELNPNGAMTQDFYGLLLAAQERHEESIAARRRAKELDPLTAVHSSDLATALLRAGRYVDALEEARRLTELEPEWPLGHAALGWAYVKKGMLDEGLAALEKAVALSPHSTMLLAQLGQAYGVAGKPERGREVLRQLEERSRQRHVPSYHLAYVYTGLGEHDKAVDALEQAYEDRVGGVYGIKGSFLFTPLRPHPRFRALLKKMNLED
ncbi:MAG: protein kinase [Longimicrobiales bacterium]